MKKCAMCNSKESVFNGLISVKFASDYERMMTVYKVYKGGSYCMRYLCGSCALAVNHIVNQFPKVEVQ